MYCTTYGEATAFTDRDWDEQLLALPTWVSTDCSTDVGMVRGKLDPNGIDAWLLSMWVAPSHRRCGIAVALVGVVVEWARAEGRKRVILEVIDHNTPAVNLYDRLGFARTGRCGPFAEPRTHVLEHERALVI